MLIVNFASGFMLELMYISLIASIRLSLILLHGFLLLALLPYFPEITFFCLCQQSKSKVKLGKASNRCQRILEADELAYVIKTKEFITSQELGSRDFWRIANSVLNKDRSVIPPLFNGPEVLPSAYDKAKFSATNFSKNSNLDDSGIPLPVSPSRTNPKLHNISESTKMVKKIIMNLDSSRASVLIVFLWLVRSLKNL